MLDEEWLKSVRSEIPDGVFQMCDKIAGCRITGLAGIGSTSVVLFVEDNNGEQLALKIRHQLCFFIRELPPKLTKKEEYDVERINQKLWHLVGNPLIDEMCREYNRLYSYMLKFLYNFQEKGQAELGIPSFCAYYIPDEEAAFILHTPGIKRRLSDLALLSPEPEPLTTEELEELEQLMTDDIVLQAYALSNLFLRLRTTIDFNPLFSCYGEKEDIINWAKLTLKDIENLAPNLPYMKPHLIAENPLYVWGAAVMDGLLTEDALPAAIAFIKEKYGELSRHPNCVTWISQLTWIAKLYVRCLGIRHILLGMDNSSELVRIKQFTEFCLLAGYVIPVYDEDFDINHIASEMGLSVEAFQQIIQQQVTGG